MVRRSAAIGGLVLATSGWLVPTSARAAEENTEQASADEPEGSDAPKLPAEDADTRPPKLPPKPNPNEQLPAPVFPPPLEPRARKLLVGADLGLVARVAEHELVNYEPALAWGGHVRLEYLDWFGTDFRWLDALDLRVGFLRSVHRIAGTGAARAPELIVTTIGARAEPTWLVAPGVRLWLGPSIAWSRLDVAAEHNVPGAATFPDRSGVLFDVGLGLGSTLDLIPGWLALELSVMAALPIRETGRMFGNEVQIFDESGRPGTAAPLPTIEASYTGLFGLNLVL